MGKVHLHAKMPNGTLCNTYGKKLTFTIFKHAVTCQLCINKLGGDYAKNWKINYSKEKDQIQATKVNLENMVADAAKLSGEILQQQNTATAGMAQAKLKPIHQVYAHHYKNRGVNRVNKIWKLKQAIVERNKIDIKMEEARLLAEANTITPYGGRTKRYACRPDCDVCKSRGLTYN